MVKLNPCTVASYLAQLYKTAGNGVMVGPIELTNAITSISNVEFVKLESEWVVCSGVVKVPQSRAELQEQHYKLKSDKKSMFRDVALYVKWDLIHEKLKQLNKSIA